jgi:hypothetical protein
LLPYGRNSLKLEITHSAKCATVKVTRNNENYTSIVYFHQSFLLIKFGVGSEFTLSTKN